MMMRRGSFSALSLLRKGRRGRASTSPRMLQDNFRLKSSATALVKATSSTVDISQLGKYTSYPSFFRNSSVMWKSTTTSTPNDEDENNLQKTTPKRKKKDPYLWDLGIPSLLPEWRKMFDPSNLVSDISAGLTVGCVAVPLSLAIAVASGVPAEVGLVTAAVSGVAGGLLGGTTLAITGPAAAISLLVVSAVEVHGLEALPVITLGVGALQVASGVTRLGVAAKLVPISVIAGFTTGVGTMILSGQIPKAFGMAAPSGLNPIQVMTFIGENVAMINPAAAALALGTSAAMWGLPKIHPKMPSALLAVGGATAATHLMALDVQLIGTLPSGLSAFQFVIPMLPSLDSFPSLAATTLLIYAMTSAESLLSCAALEKMKKTTYKHNPDQELIGQGLANVGAGLFMGMPVTSVIARSGLNVRLNAETRLASLVQAGFVFSSVVFFSDSISNIPMPALSGMLITTGLGMLNPTEFKHCYAVQKMDTIPFIATIGGMVAFGLAEGIGIGCASAVAVQYGASSSSSARSSSYKMMVSPVNGVPLLPEGTAVQSSKDLQVVNDHLYGDRGSSETSSSTAATSYATTLYRYGIVWQLFGPINFMSMFEIDNMIRDMKDDYRDTQLTTTTSNDLSSSSMTLPIVVDMKGVTTLEFTGVEELVNRLIEVSHHPDDHTTLTTGIPITMMNCTDELHKALDQCDPKQRIQRFPPLAVEMQ
jgi:MFS superfamily sulfate permease-like transporter